MTTQPLYQAYYQSPLGLISVQSTATAITAVLFTEVKAAPATASPPLCLQEALQQLDEYFNGKRRSFLLPLQPEGTAFQQRVWQELKKIPFGSTLSYHTLSERLLNPRAIRAVGAANGQNPLCIVVPCHRVIGSDGSLTGYAGGLWRKEWLLRHEGSPAGGKQMSLF